jgi:hypothetical protein
MDKFNSFFEYRGSEYTQITPCVVLWLGLAGADGLDADVWQRGVPARCWFQSVGCLGIE